MSLFEENVNEQQFEARGGGRVESVHKNKSALQDLIKEFKELRNSSANYHTEENEIEEYEFDDGEEYKVSEEESASIDGASYMTIFVKIIWPLSKPILATIAIWCAVGHWNSFQDSLILMSGAPKLKTLQERLYIYLNQSSNLAASMGTATTGLSETQRQEMLNTKSIQYTVAMVTAIPILCVYPFMQKYFVKGLMLGAVKG